MIQLQTVDWQLKGRQMLSHESLCTGVLTFVTLDPEQHARIGANHTNWLMNLDAPLLWLIMQVSFFFITLDTGPRSHTVDYEGFVGTGFRGVKCRNLHHIRPES